MSGHAAAIGTPRGLPEAAHRPPTAWLQRRPKPAQAAIEREAAWRQLSEPRARDATRDIAVSRWLSLGDGRSEVSRGPTSGFHIIAVALRHMRAELSVAGVLVHRGRILPGMYHVTPPGQAAHAVFHGGCDALHLHVPDAVLRECREAAEAGGRGPAEAGGRGPAEAGGWGPAEAGGWGPASAGLGQDPVVERLARALLHGGDDPGSDSLHVELVCLALMTRLLSCRSGLSQGAGRSPSPLLPWRLSRVISFIDAHLETTIGLADLARAAGLTRMHFAAQFRAATGVRPHDYVQQRRIERAQALLSTSDMPLVQVALSTGFQTQAHFTTVFRRLSGDTPHAWRRSFQAAGNGVPDLTTRPCDTPGRGWTSIPDSIPTQTGEHP